MIDKNERHLYDKIQRFYPALYRRDLKVLRYAELNKIISESKTIISRMNDDDVKLVRREKEIEEICLGLSPLDKVLYKLHEEKRDSECLFQKVFKRGETEKQREIALKMRALEQRIAPLRDQLRKLGNPERQRRFLKSDCELLSWYIKKLEPIAEKKKDLEDTWIDLRNKAASNSVQIREVADIVKERIGKQEFCPYCGGDLGESPHADHIYPVSKGGRSTIKNMVYVCASCNMAKLDMTLSTFIRTYNLDRDEIEKRLADMGKEF